MGANQSTGDNNRSARSELQPVKKCYYELLEVDEQASEEEIKKAYRKKALELHPDRNYGNVEESTNLFANVQSAYEILSDAQERAWYDSHRREILRGEEEIHGDHYEHNVRITTTEDIFRMLPKISSCRDFSNSSSGFFNMLNAAFGTLAKEEQLACEWENDDPVTYPDFGNAGDQYDPEVRAFYSGWSNFATRKAFSWVDMYRYSEAPDRRVRRLMEKENRRLRDEAVREFNDAIRSLVAFVKKRDPRFKPTVQSEAERQKVLRGDTLAQAARSRAANRANADRSAVPHWAQPVSHVSSDESEMVEVAPKETYECVACRKLFKSEKQFEAHERSKKHVKAAGLIRREMEEEDRELHLAQQVPEETLQGSASERSRLESPEYTSDALAQGVGGSATKDTTITSRTGNVQKSDAGSALGTDLYSNSLADPASASASEEDEYADREKSRQRILGQQGGPNGGKHVELSSNTDGKTVQIGERGLDEDDDGTPQRRLGKTKVKRAKKAARKSAANAGLDVELSSRFPFEDETLQTHHPIGPRKLSCGRVEAQQKAIR
ncbi:MAG: hypothetical protein Q9207_006743 [Kuettlingeria erythrocarpa]